MISEKRVDIYHRLLCCINKEGKKIKAKRALTKIVKRVAKLTKIPFYKTTRIIHSKLKSIIELKSVRIRKNTFLIPTPVKKKRINYLIVKTVIDSAKEDTTNRAFDNKLSEEIINIITKSQSKSTLKKTTLLKQTLINRANVHYRW